VGPRLCAPGSLRGAALARTGTVRRPPTRPATGRVLLVAHAADAKQLLVLLVAKAHTPGLPGPGPPATASARQG
jgi:hypothetical protein